MSGRTVKCAAALCFAAFFATAAARALPAMDPKPEVGVAGTVRAWMTTWMTRTTAAWTVLTSTSEEPPAPVPVVDAGAGSDEGWLIDPNG